MDNVQTGKLIAALRKQKGLTQQQLADRLNLSNKTISKWESGAGSPDLSNLPPLADALGGVGGRIAARGIKVGRRSGKERADWRYTA